MRYRLLGLEPTSLFRFAFLGLWIALGGLGLIGYAVYLIGSIESGLVEDEFLAALFGCLLGPPLISLAVAGFSVLRNRIYKRLLRKLPPVIVEMEKVNGPVVPPAQEGRASRVPNGIP